METIKDETEYIGKCGTCGTTHFCKRYELKTVFFSFLLIRNCSFCDKIPLRYSDVYFKKKKVVEKTTNVY